MNPLATHRFRPPATWAWLPLALWHGGFLGGIAGMAGAGAGWLLGALAGHRGGARGSVGRPLWSGPAVAGLAQALSFPAGNLAAALLAPAWPAGTAAGVLFVQGALSFAGTGLWLASWSRAWPRLGWAAETVTGLLFVLAPLAAHRDGGLTYPHWLTDGFSVRGWAVHAGYFGAGAAFLGCLLLRGAAVPEPAFPAGKRSRVAPGLALLLVIPAAWLLFGHVRLPLVSSPPPETAPPPPGSGPESPPPDSPRESPPPPQEDHAYEALVRFRGLPPRCPVQWGGQFYRIERFLPPDGPTEPAGDLAEVYLFSDALAGPPAPLALTSAVPFPPPPGVRRAYRTVSRIPDRGYDPELFPFYRIADRIGRVAPEPLPADWAWLDDALPARDGIPPDETIAAIATWLRAHVLVDPESRTLAGDQIAARTLPVRADAAACLEIAVRWLRSRGIAARVAEGYRVPFPDRGEPPSDVLLLRSMRASWLEVELGAQGWQPLPLALPGPPPPPRNEPDPERLQHVLELLRRESPPDLRPRPETPLPWVWILPGLFLVWRAGVTWRTLWGEPMAPGTVPAAGALSRALELLAASGLDRRAFGETCAGVASRLQSTVPALGNPMRGLAEALDAEYAALDPGPAGKRNPSPGVRAAYAAFLRALIRRRPAFFLRFLLPGSGIRRNEGNASDPPPWTPPPP
jgi:hypothetical protein